MTQKMDFWNESLTSKYTHASPICAFLSFDFFCCCQNANGSWRLNTNFAFFLIFLQISLLSLFILFLLFGLTLDAANLHICFGREKKNGLTKSVWGILTIYWTYMESLVVIQFRMASSCSDNSKTPDVLADEKIIILGMAARHTTYILWHTLSDRIDSKTKIS